MRSFTVLAPLLLSVLTVSQSQNAGPITVPVLSAQDQPQNHPVVLYVQPPEYSKEARDKKISGNVLIGLIVSPQGKPIDVHVVRGIGYGLDEKAVDSVKHYKFRRAVKDGVPVAFPMNVEVNFELN